MAVEIFGTTGRTYRSGEGVCFETQGFPDAPNHPQFPSAMLVPGAAVRLDDHLPLLERLSLRIA